MGARSRIPGHLAAGAFTTREAREAGVGRGRLRGRDVAHPHRGVHLLGGTRVDVVSRCRTLLAALAPGHAFSHRTAARIWGIPLPYAYAESESLHVTSAGSSVAVRHAGVVGWVTARRLEVHRRAGLPVVSPADAWCQLALRGAVIPGAVLGHEWLVAAGDYLVSGTRRVGGSRTAPLCTLDELREAVTRRRGQRGVTALTAALEDIRSPVDSPRETRLRLGLLRAGLPEPVVQCPVPTVEGILHSDLGYPEAKLLLEYQGEEHRVSRRRWLSDLRRVQLFQDAGYTVFLIGDADVTPDCDALAARVRSYLRRAH